MILSDRDLRALLDEGKLVLEPFDAEAVQPSSIDVRIGPLFRVFANHRYPFIDVREQMDDLTELVEASEEEPFVLHPGEFVLASTLEKVTLPDDHVARLEGKSSLGRLGLLIHSSLPGSEEVLVLAEGQLRPRPISEVVEKRLEGWIAGFDPETLHVDYHRITGWYSGPADRIYEVVLASGRSVRVTAGHNLFTLDRDGQVRKVRTGELAPGTHVALPRHLPDPWPDADVIDLLRLADETDYADLMVEGPLVSRLFERAGRDVAQALKAQGLKHVAYYRGRARLPFAVARQLCDLNAEVGPRDRLSVRQSSYHLPPRIAVTPGIAWLIGLYVAEGSRRRGQAVWSNTDQGILDRVEAVLTELGVPVSRAPGGITACSHLISLTVKWLGCGQYAAGKRIPPVVFSWPEHLQLAFLDGFIDGDGSREATRISLWTCSADLVGDFLLLAQRLGRRASVTSRVRDGRHLHQVMLPHREHKLLTAVPLPDLLLRRLREESGLTLKQLARLAGYRHDTSIANIENRTARDAVRTATLRRLRAAFLSVDRPLPSLAYLNRLLDGGLQWDRVVEVRDTGETEPIYDLEVRPNGHKIENFVAGFGGVLVSNTAGFVDPGFSGHLTLELSNVANLPIAIYPGMKIGQLCLLRMTSPAETPYGSRDLQSKYQGQVGPTASRYFENFRREG